MTSDEPNDTPATPEAPPPEIPSNLPRVLIVDDSESARQMLVLFVEKAGAESVVASSAAEAFIKIEEAVDASRPFVMILMDIRMPQLNGNEATKQLREAGYKGTIVACTAGVTGGGRKKSMQIGFNAYLDKASMKVETLRALLAESASKTAS